MPILHVEAAVAVSATVKALLKTPAATERTMAIIHAKLKRTPTRTLKPKGGLK
jgi:hypothetical protein